MRRTTRTAGTMLLVVTPLITLSDRALSNDAFVADRTGGGPDEMLTHAVQFSRYVQQSTEDRLLAVADGAGGYTADVVVDSNAEVVVIAEQAIDPLQAQPTVELLPSEAVGLSSDELKPIMTEELVADTTEGVLSTATDLGRGAYTLRVIGGERTAPIVLVDHRESPYALIVTKEEQPQDDGKRITINAQLSNNVAFENDAEVVASRSYAVSDSRIVATITGPAGATREVRLVDTGNLRRDGDETRGDGIYSAEFEVRASGKTGIHVKFDGTFGDRRFSRTAELVTYVGAARMVAATQRLTATPGTVAGDVVEAERYGLPLEVDVTAGDMPDIVRTRAEVWAFDMLGNDAAVGWIGGMVRPIPSGDNFVLPFSFHEGWLEQGQYTGPFSLRNVEVTDIDNGDGLYVGNGSISIENIAPRFVARKRIDRPTAPSAAMRKGVHPALIPGSAQYARFAPRTRFTRDLLLLNGWCDDQAKPSTPFNSTIRAKALRYTQTTQGDSADRRAVNVMQWLSYTPGRLRGIVAHSQGGLVAATLLENFSYVFADNARSRPPNVITIGSPFYGARLASDARSTSDFWKKVFGLPRCDVPYDLQRGSNPSWRAQIGWVAKYQMQAWFTTHTRFKVCGLGSARIRDRDDGVIKPTEGTGFVDGGERVEKNSNRCHTREVSGQLGGSSNRDQWEYPRFVNAVNQLFNSDTEDYQPF